MAITLTSDQAHAELLARDRAATSLVDYAQYIDVPGAPVGDQDENCVDWAYEPVGNGQAAHHVLILETIQKVIEGELPRAMFFMPPGSAKALALDTPIPTPTGWSLMGDLAVGDQVFDENGQVCNVTWKSQVFENRPCFEVRTDCGDSVIADRDHEWLVCLDRKPRKALVTDQDRGDGRGLSPLANRDDPMSRHKIKETWELAKRRTKRPMIQRATALNLPEADLSVDPYILGVWLGDGDTAGMRITSDVADQTFVRAEFERRGYQTTDQSNHFRFGITGVRDKFVSLGLLNGRSKIIPEQYLRASYNQRLALLQGLVDSDGTVCKKRGCTTYCGVDKALVLQVRELVRSLGVKAGWSVSRAKLNGKDCGESYKVSFYLKDSARLPRKAVLTRDQHRTPNTYIEVTPAANADTVCIEVDSDSHLFLCGRAMTPTHNSTYGSTVAPTWAMGRLPGTQIILASYGSDLAKKHGRKARAITRSPEFKAVFDCELSKTTSAADEWALTSGSEYMSAGILSGITGNRAHGIIIDDPIKGRDEADSETIRNKTWDAYQDDIKTRLIPGGWEVIIQTRWHEDDLAGRLLPEDYAGESGLVECRDGRKWYIVNLPAEAERSDDPLGRAIGERLWADWFTEDHFAGFKSQPRTWSALFQQRPAPDAGTYFQRDWFHRFRPHERPSELDIYSTSDFAVTEKSDADHTEHGVWGVDEYAGLWMIDWWHGQKTSDVWIDRLLDLFDMHKPVCWFGEGGVIRQAIEPFLIRMMIDRESFCRVEWVNPIKDKPTRARAFQARAASGMVHIPVGPEGDRIVDQLVAFPAGRFDDAVDVCSLIGMVIDQAHPAIVTRKNKKPRTEAEKDWESINGVEVSDAVNLDD